MGQSVAGPADGPISFELAGWKSVAGGAAAALLAIMWLVAGVWKVTDPYGAAARFTQLLIPPSLSVPSAIGLGILETFTGLLLIVPRFRRWGAWLSVLLLVAFMIYVGINYSKLLGEECSCFPWIKRSVGPGFFIGDMVMVLFAVAAGRWSRP